MDAPEPLFQALADPTRRRILHLLAAGETCVGDLVSALRLPQPTASRHLARLRRAGLVRARRAGTWVFYALAEPRGPLHAKLLECLPLCAAGEPELARDARRMERLRARGGCCPEHTPAARSCGGRGPSRECAR